ncbi:hypothetical protein L21SP5_00561 [Salinivirga cyanobacteriivorans]|uniref:Uncharacterized protein n=1 Tax=Salinivirga cyanobacteriivorans TaxID=1307839 RepID=A0A0S2HW11_9BACT|nr:hypothetical protein L21SP5_00561 [Salinivirga cyanobacteriivorans]
MMFGYFTKKMYVRFAKIEIKEHTKWKSKTCNKY